MFKFSTFKFQKKIEKRKTKTFIKYQIHNTGYLGLDDPDFVPMNVQKNIYEELFKPHTFTFIHIHAFHAFTQT